MAINSINGNTLLQSGSFPPVRAASTGSPLTPSTGGLLVVDGVQLVAGDRVLCKDESSAINNGIYAASTGPWVRTSDASSNQQFFSGMAVTVGLGSVNAGQTFICTTTDDPVVVGTSNITFASQQAVATATQSATSITSLTIGTGSKTLTIQPGKAFQVNQWVLIQETSAAANQMLGQITAYSGTSLTVNVSATGGSGTHADWTIVLTNSAAAAGFQPPTGTGNVTGPGSSTAGHVATFADSTGKVLQDGGTIVGGANTITPSMLANAAVAFGVGMLNGTLVAAVAANALTIAVKTLAGNDPSSSDPTFFLFRDASAGYAVIEQTAALSIVVPSGATLGTVNGQANRIWVGVWNNGGTAVLGVYNTVSSPGLGTGNILSWDETSTANGTGITSGSTSAQIWYTGSTLSAKVFRILGYVESTQATAGTWVTTPSKVQLMGPGVKRPGDIVQVQQVINTTSDAIGSATFVPLAHTQITITPQSAANCIQLTSSISGQTGVAATTNSRISRGNTAATNMIGNNCGMLSNGNAFHMENFAFDFPNTVSPQIYAVQSASIGAQVNNFPAAVGSTFMMAQEIQI